MLTLTPIEQSVIGKQIAELKSLLRIQFIALSLQSLEDDLPPDIRSQLAALPLSGDAALWKIAKARLG